MRTAKWLALLSATGWVAACADDITAPGFCPEFCPDAQIEVLDTVLTNIVERDSSYFGYVLPHVGAGIPVTDQASATRSAGVIEFLRFSETIADGTTGAPIGVASVDSFQVTLRMRSRAEVSGLEFTVHRLPVGLDSTTTFTQMMPFLEDSAMVGFQAVADTVEADSVLLTIPASEFPTYAADSNRAVIGVQVRGASAAFAVLASSEVGTGSLIRRFVTDTSGVVRSDTRATNFDTFLREASPPMPANALVAGEVPSARSLLRFNLPPSIIDSATVVGARLFLVPVAPVLGASGDTIQVQANGLSADFGAKSPLVLIVSSAGSDSTSGAPSADVAVGTMDTVVIDVTAIVRNWQSTEGRPHSMVIRVSPEGASIGSLFFGDSQNPAAAPSLRLTYVTPFRFEG